MLAIIVIIPLRVLCWLSAGIGATVLVPVFGIGVVAFPRPMRPPTSAVAFVKDLFERDSKGEASPFGNITTQKQGIVCSLC